MASMKVKVDVDLSVEPNEEHFKDMRFCASKLTDNKDSITVSVIPETTWTILIEFTMPQARQADVEPKIVQVFTDGVADIIDCEVKIPLALPDDDQAKSDKALEKEKQRKVERELKKDPDYRCFLCGKRSKLIQADCCGKWICNDEHKYVAFSYARNSCHRNHSRFTLCAFHHGNEHEGDWQTCEKCKENFKDQMEMYVWYGTNEYNWETLPNPPSYEPTTCIKCGRVIPLADGGYKINKDGYTCDNCYDTPSAYRPPVPQPKKRVPAKAKKPAKPSPAAKTDPQTVDIVFKGAKSQMSKAQRAFLLAKKTVEELQQDLSDTTAKFETVLAEHTKLVAPKLETVTGLQKKFISTCASFLSEDKPPKKPVRKNIATCVLDLFDSLFARHVQLDDEMQTLHDTILDTYFPEPSEEQKEIEDADAFDAMKSYCEDMFFAHTGQHINLDGLRPDMSREEIDDHISGIFDAHPKNPKNRKKTKRELEKEELEKQTEEARTKNINAVYRQLARLFHPDLEQDPELRAKKEVLMKELTSAYEKGDLHTILKLELRWLQNNDGDISKLSDAKLDAYTAALEQQCNEIRDEIYAALHHPRFSPLWDVIIDEMAPLHVCLSDVDDEVMTVEDWAYTLEQDIEELERIQTMPKDAGREQALRVFMKALKKNLTDPIDDFIDDFEF